jgi:propionyl-CoA carboxylase alpha chain
VTITRLLVANRGEIARRVFRTARAMGIGTVAVFAPDDAGELFVQDADDSVRIDGYLRVDDIVAAAQQTGADAVHPGYGFLSENAAFAQAVIDAGLVWVGPAPEVIAAMGDKLRAKEAAAAADVPTLPSSQTPADAGSVGYPLLVKAAGGGGGKGMRIVTDPADLADAVASARREAGASFGDDRVFLERYIPRSRHIEIQILGDNDGRVVHLGERECSIQRRHQKLVEESPSPFVGPALREQMGAAAVRLAESIGYTSAGTVEFLVDDTTAEFWFLEVNTRLQVEHAVTEAVTGMDLVAAQLAIAAGDAAPLEPPRQSGHSIEVRLCAENPAAGFLPTGGTVSAFEPLDGDIRWETGVATGSVVGLGYDPMVAKVIAHAATRGECIAKLASALEGLHFGGLTTNRELLVAVLRHPAFADGRTTTDFIDRENPCRTLQPTAAERDAAAVAAALWLQGRHRAGADVLGFLPSGWRNGRLPDQRVVLTHGDDVVEVDYRSRPHTGDFLLADGRSAVVHQWCSENIDLEVDRLRRRYRITGDGGDLLVQTSRGTMTFGVVPRFVPPGAELAAGGFVAPMPGNVVAVHCRPGDAVVKGQPLVVLEAMKMEHQVTAPFDGSVAQVGVDVGDHVAAGTVLLVFEEATA